MGFLVWLTLLAGSVSVQADPDPGMKFVSASLGESGVIVVEDKVTAKQVRVETQHAALSLKLIIFTFDNIYLYY